MPSIVGNLRTPRLATAPLSPAPGEMYYNTTDNKLYWWDGTSWVSAAGGTAAAPTPGLPIGALVIWPTATAPTSFLLCDGGTYAQTTYPDLAAVFGVATGNFNVPDLRDRFVYGASATEAVGVSGGAASVTLTDQQSGMRAHSHGGNTVS